MVLRILKKYIKLKKDCMKDGKRGKERNEEWRKRDGKGKREGREKEERKDMNSEKKDAEMRS